MNAPRILSQVILSVEVRLAIFFFFRTLIETGKDMFRLDISHQFCWASKMTRIIAILPPTNELTGVICRGP